MKIVKRIALMWGLLALITAPLAGPVSAEWETPSDEDPTYFGGGNEGPNDGTTDPDEPFDGLDRIVNPDREVLAVRQPSFLERLVRLMQSLWTLKG